MAGCCISFLRMISLSGVFVLGLVGVFTLIGFEKLQVDKLNPKTNEYENFTTQRAVSLLVAGGVHLVAFVLLGAFAKENNSKEKKDIIEQNIKNDYTEIKKDNLNNNYLINDDKQISEHKMSPTEEAIFTGVQRLPITLSMMSEDRLND